MNLNLFVFFYHFKWNKKCDGLLMFAITEDRLKLVDTSHTYLYMPVSILIPLPESTVSVYAVFESFDKWV